MTKPKNDTRKLAKKYNVTDRTIRRWKAAGAPLADAKAMPAWIASNKNVPPKLTVDTGQAAVSAVSGPPEPLEKGAAHTLQRLEQREASVYSALLAATEAGDVILAKALQRQWLEVSKALATFDQQVEEGRRAANETISRAELEKVLSTWLYFNRIAFHVAAHGSVMRLLRQEDTAAIANILNDVEVNARCAAIVATRQRAEYPAWLGALCESSWSDGLRLPPKCPLEQALVELVKIMSEVQPQAEPEPTGTTTATPAEATKP